MSLSETLFQEAQKYIPGGVNSPVRACKSVDATPLFIKKAEGSRITSVEGASYIDYVLSWGPMILGHAHPDVTEAAVAAAKKGASYGAPCEAEIDLARAVCHALPTVEMVRMVNSGTEATMSALRLARGYTGRNKVLKFIGGYHGHGDPFLASAGSGVATLAIPGTPGVPADVVAHTLLAQYNDLEQVKAHFERHGDDIACIIVEPVAGNMGLVLPKPGFLEGLREITRQYGALLIFDEVITGFRVDFGGAQKRFGIQPDLTCLGKIIGGGFPVGAYGGRRDIMQRIAPCGDVYQAGTLSGNPVAMAAGTCTLELLSRADYPALERRTQALVAELKAIFAEKSVPVVINQIASIFTIFFTQAPEVVDFPTASTADSARYTRFYGHMREKGVYLAPSGYECAFLSFAHSERDINITLEAVRSAQL
ncbi:MAG: glutamate-1-semialdehyde 2,1-aminomutase [Desulfocurvibacter africanus]